MERFLSKNERKDLRRQHRGETERRYADRIKALILWDKGWTLEEISEALLLDESTVRRYRRLYESFLEFQQVCRDFFKNLARHRSQLQSLLTDTFQIIEPTF